MKNNQILSSACLLTMEKILCNSEENFTSLLTDIINKDDFYLTIFQSLMAILMENKNNFALKCFFKVCLLTKKENLVKIFSQISLSVNSMIKIILQDTSDEQFNVLIFEVVAVLMKKYAEINENNNNNLVYLYNFFEEIKENLLFILSNNIVDLLGYVFQISNLYLDYIKSDNFIHQTMLNNLLLEENWNVNMKFLFQAYIIYIDNCLKYLTHNINAGTFTKLLNIVFKVIINILFNKYNKN
jgi:hypothetical protein